MIDLNFVILNSWSGVMPFFELVANFNELISWIALILSVIVLIISFLAYLKSKSKRLLLVFLAFSLFFIKSLLTVIDIYYSPGYFMNFAVQGFFDMLVITFLCIALFKK
jgi:hypothetical protein